MYANRVAFVEDLKITKWKIFVDKVSVLFLRAAEWPLSCVDMCAVGPCHCIVNVLRMSSSVLVFLPCLSHEILISL